MPLFALDANSFPAYLRRKPLNTTATTTIAAGGTGTINIPVPAGKVWMIQQVLITAGTGITVTGCLIDNVESNIRQSVSDCRTYFGDLLIAEAGITVTANNSGTAAADLKVQIIGLEV